jgi:hypothetical protein
MKQRPNRTDFFWFGSVRFGLIFKRAARVRFGSSCLYKIQFGSVRFGSRAFLKRAVRVRFGSSEVLKIGSGLVRFNSDIDYLGQKSF